MGRVAERTKDETKLLFCQVKKGGWGKTKGGGGGGGKRGTVPYPSLAPRKRGGAIDPI